MKDVLTRLLDRRDLTEEEAYAAMDAIFAGDATPAQMAAFLVALRMKGETVSEIVGFARAMRDKCNRIAPRVSGRLTDTCGTGGAAVKTFNVSTAAAFVAAGAGVPIAKHGNRSVTSPSGSADVLEALGAKLDLTPDKVQGVIERVGVGFLFAPVFHPAMKFAAPVRKELGIRTVFNLLGPLTNPAGAKAQVLGVFHQDLVDTYANVLVRLGVERALVVHGTAGLDEVSTLGPTLVSEVEDGQVRKYALHPREFGLREARADQVSGVPPAESARQVLGLLNGGAAGDKASLAAGGARGLHGGLDDAPRREMMLLNAACAIYVGGKADTVRAGIQRARESVESGAARTKLLEFVKATGGSVPDAVRARETESRRTPANPAGG